MPPLLNFVGDGQEHSLRETIDYLADEFRLSVEERKELFPSGSQKLFNNRVVWALAYIRKLKKMVWHVLRIWQHELKKDQEKCIDKVIFYIAN
jgi:restriction endonuclease Mrr